MPKKKKKELRVFVFYISPYSRSKEKQTFFFFFGLFRAALAAYGGSQARGQIGATAAGLHHSHGNTRSKLSLQPTPQLMAMLHP